MVFGTWEVGHWFWVMGHETCHDNVHGVRYTVVGTWEVGHWFWVMGYGP